MFALLAACGTATHTERDPTDYLAVGVDPALEAHTLEETLSASEYRPSSHAEGTGWTAFAMTRADGASLARLVTRRGVVVALDEAPTAIAPARGLLGIDTERSGTDLDRDGTPDVILVRNEADRRCLLVVGVDDDGGAQPIVVDTANLGEGVCLEDVRDVDGNEQPEAIVAVRARALARATVPTAELPLERDATGVYRRSGAPARFIADERAARRARISAARSIPDAEIVYTAAVELALVSFVAGEDTDAQLAVFDDAMAGVVLDVDMLTAVHYARGEIAAGRVAR